MAHIFISYSSRNRVYAARLTTYLRDSGYTVWINMELLEAGAWLTQVTDAIERAAAVILIMSPDALENPRVQREIAFAREKKKPIFPLLLYGEVFPSFKKLRYHDVRDGQVPSKRFLDELRRSGATRADETTLITPTVPAKSVYNMRPVPPLTIFVSYKSEERPIVERLAYTLKSGGHDVWFDRELKAGQDWWDEICHNIRACSLMITALSPRYISSTACRLEYEYAYALNKRILPVEIVRLGGGIKKLATPLQRRQLVRWLNGGDRSDNTMLVEALEGLAPTQPLPDPLPPQPEAPINELSKLNDRLQRGDVGDLTTQLGMISVLKRYLEHPEQDDRLFARELLGKLQLHADLKADAVREVDALIAAYDRKPQNPLNRWFKRGG